MRSFRSDYLQAGTQTYAPLVGTPARYGALNVDGAINLINTDLSLFTSAGYLRDVKITACNRTTSTVKIRVAHIDGAIGAINDADYLYYDIALFPKETKVVNIDGMSSSDTVLVRSDTTNVTFSAIGQVMSEDFGYRRLAATTVVADTDTLLYTATGLIETITICACNKDYVNSAYIRVAIIDSTLIGALSVEDYILYDELLIPNEFKPYNLQMDLPTNYSIGVRSTNANVNFISYGRLI